MTEIILPTWLVWLIAIYVGVRIVEHIVIVLLHGMEWYEKKWQDEYKRMREKDDD